MLDAKFTENRYVVCGISCSCFVFMDSLTAPRLQVNIWRIQTNTELTRCHKNNICTTLSLCWLFLRHGTYWLEYYPCLDLKVNDEFWNYSQSEGTVWNMGMEGYTATYNRNYTMLCIEVLLVNRCDKLHALIKNQ